MKRPLPLAAAALAAAATKAATPLTLAAARRGLATAVAPNIQHSDLAYRALLRNLRLLVGLRKDRPTFNVVITGVNADQVAAAMGRLEPAIRFEVVGDGSASASLETLASKAEESVDSVIVCQPYHVLRAPGGEQLAAIRRVLHDEDGTVGFVWHRATGHEEWVRALAAGAGGGGAGRADLLPPMPPGAGSGASGMGAAVDGPIAWMARSLPVEAAGFKPLKHRKFVERLTAPALDELLPVAQLTCDARPPPGGASSSWDAGVAAARAAEASRLAALPAEAADGGGDAPRRGANPRDACLTLDLHAFHAQVVPRKVKSKN